MSTIERPDRRVLPPLEAGQRLDQRTFHERYEAMPPSTRAELIGGVVHMPSPLSYPHGRSTCEISAWIIRYRLSTPGVLSASNATVILGEFGEPQPDHCLFIAEDRGGAIRLVGDFISGPPELIIEVARSTHAIDLGARKLDYERAGVTEYVVVELDPDRVHWFKLDGSRYVEHTSGTDGIFRSDVFPGLWLDPTALYADDLAALFATLDRGLGTPEHAAFVARLADVGREG